MSAANPIGWNPCILEEFAVATKLSDFKAGTTKVSEPLASLQSSAQMDGDQLGGMNERPPVFIKHQPPILIGSHSDVLLEFGS